MNELYIITLKVLKKIYSKIFGEYTCDILNKEENPNIASEIIIKYIDAEKPCMIARFGSTELMALVNYTGVNSAKHSLKSFVKGKQPEWWWNKNIMKQMQEWSGFFPPTPENLQKFGDLMMQDIKELDVLGSWINDEGRFVNELANVKLVHLRLLEPFWAKNPWTSYLKGKKVLIVHPFANDILYQYTNKRNKLFANPNILPEFASIRVIKAVQSLGGENNGFKDWFEALQWMKDEINKEDYDICLIGCGAYGFPLAAHVKRQGKKAIHLGGALQLLFGIKGKRWENPNYGVKEWGIPYGSYTSIINKYWISPSKEGQPKNADKVEGGCYW